MEIRKIQTTGVKRRSESLSEAAPRVLQPPSWGCHHRFLLSLPVSAHRLFLPLPQSVPMATIMFPESKCSRYTYQLGYAE